MPDNIRRIEDVDGPEAWYRSLPVVTRTWFTLAIGLTCAGNFKVVSVYSLLYNWEQLKAFEVWRLLTPFCYVGGWSFPTLIGLYMLVQYSRQYESSPYNTGAGGGTADYAFCLTFGALGLLLTYPLVMGFVSPLFTRNLTFYILYIWSKQSPTAQVNVWGVPMKAQFLPFAYILLNLVMGNSYYDLIHGLVVGHAYYFLVDVVPAIYGKDYLHTPQIFIDYFGVGAYVAPAGGPPGQGNNTWAPPGRVNGPRDAAAAATGSGRTHTWGSNGQALGRS